MIRLIYLLVTVAAFANGIVNAATQQDAAALPYFGAGAALTAIATLYYAYKDCRNA